MDTSKILQQCLHQYILPPGASDLEGGYSGGQEEFPGSIHMWSVRYASLDRYFPLLSTLVSPEEEHKAAGFKKSDDTRRYTLRQGILRVILGQYIQEDPEKIQIVRKKSGKPDLHLDGRYSDVRFSLSHTDEMVCLGITRTYEIGLDIVKTNSTLPFPEIEHYLFTPGERRWIEQTLLEQRSLPFFRIWSLKEALLKATGSDATMMKEADVSGIITEKYLNGFYTIQLGKKDFQFFIGESDCGEGHHCVIASCRNKKKINPEG
jgi:phosphopantetheinyl transferase